MFVGWLPIICLCSWSFLVYSSFHNSLHIVFSQTIQVEGTTRRERKWWAVEIACEEGGIGQSYTISPKEEERRGAKNSDELSKIEKLQIMKPTTKMLVYWSKGFHYFFLDKLFIIVKSSFSQFFFCIYYRALFLALTPIFYLGRQEVYSMLKKKPQLNVVSLLVNYVSR